MTMTAEGISLEAAEAKLGGDCDTLNVWMKFQKGKTKC